MEWLETDTANCGVQRAIDVVGDRWTLLILREAFNGVRTFDSLARHLAVSESVLSRRLNALVDAGVLRREPYRQEGRRTHSAYRLTERGLDLFPVLVALLRWGDRHLGDERGSAWSVTHAGCGTPVEVVARCPRHGGALGPFDTETGPGDGAAPLAAPDEVS